MKDILKELWAYLRERQRGWLMPILVVMLAIGVLAVIAQTTTLGPFLYTLF
jgi:hypothetical protein